MLEHPFTATCVEEVSLPWQSSGFGLAMYYAGTDACSSCTLIGLRHHLGIVVSAVDLASWADEGTDCQGV
jgi:hypothetical protein